MSTSPLLPSGRLAGLLAFLLLILPQPLARAESGYFTYWGAIAYSQSTGKWGYSRHWLSEVNAKRVAKENCKAEDATIVALIGNYWVAFALGDDKTAYGVGWAENPDAAKETALKECNKRTANARIVVCFNCRDDDR